MILADSHTHTCFSFDSDTCPDAQADAAIAAGLQYLCITDHYDPGIGSEESSTPDLESYFRAIDGIQAAYAKKLRILRGIELGLSPEGEPFISDFLRFRPYFDFIIGSVHYVQGDDPGEHAFWQKWEGTTGYRAYYESTLDNVSRYHGYDVCGHLDYVSRYGKQEQRPYDIKAYLPLIDEILKVLIRKGIGLECNTAGIRSISGIPNPDMVILKRYRELGGEILTVGSDAHVPEHIGYQFDSLRDYLKACGFQYYTVFQKHKPLFYPL